MRLYASQLKIRARVRDLETGRDLKQVIWVDEEAGMAEAYATNSDGSVKIVVDPVTGERVMARLLLKGKFRLVPIHDPLSPRPDFDKMMGAPQCARCGSPLTIRGDDLCPKCWRADRGRPVQATRTHPFEFHKCEKCSRDATWSVIDEVEVTPQQGVITTAQRIPNGKYLFDRSQQVGRRYYCSWCFRGPRLLDHKGEVIQEVEDGIRPDR